MLVLGAGVDAAPIRVTTWCFQSKADIGTNGAAQRTSESQIQEAADVLKKLNADVIVLQQVQDWQSCDELARALAPEKYGVVVCSSFRDARTGALSRQQVAILSKAKAYISWSEAWKSRTNGVAGGFAFAAIRVGNKNAGFFSVQLGEADGATNEGSSRTISQQVGRELAARQLRQQIASVRHWDANSIQAVVVAGDFNDTFEEVNLDGAKIMGLFEEVGLTNAFLNVPLDKRVTFAGDGHRAKGTFDYILTRDAGRVAIPEVLPLTFSERYPVSCEMDFEGQPLPPPPIQVARAEPLVVKATTVQTNAISRAASAPAMKPVAVVVKPDNSTGWRTAVVVAGAVLLVAIIWKLARRARAQGGDEKLLTLRVERGVGVSFPAGAERIVIMPRSAQGPGNAGGGAADNPPVVHIDTPGRTRAQSHAWQESEAVRVGLLQHLSRWMKEKLVHRLLTDRAQLLAAQQAAALTALAVDQRLAKVEMQIQQRNQMYEQRIEELLQELATAQEENRELIWAKITLVKAEMERERLKAAQHSKEHLQN
ncbi:MAG: hypothetical protein JWR26_2105 [Pedosphaera sp.]|nr:hypothetical protein [Pedosphaera sp.]